MNVLYEVILRFFTFETRNVCTRYHFGHSRLAQFLFKGDESLACDFLFDTFD